MGQNTVNFVGETMAHVSISGGSKRREREITSPPRFASIVQTAYLSPSNDILYVQMSFLLAAAVVSCI